MLLLLLLLRGGELSAGATGQVRGGAMELYGIAGIVGIAGEGQGGLC